MNYRKILKVLALFVVFLIVVFSVFMYYQTRKAEKGKAEVLKELNHTKYPKLESLGSVRHLSILPLIDFHSSSDNLKTEAGVAYLIRADDLTILMDVGLNANQSHPSPLLQNMNQLNVKLSDIDMLFFSHSHPDHVGGMKESQDKTFSLSQGIVDVRNASAFVPESMKASDFNPVDKIEVITSPTVIHPGIASIGSIPRYLFVAGMVREQSLAINVQGKGIVVVVGCGHPTIERIIQRVKMITDVPIYGIIGGLHYPINGGRFYIGPFNIQYIVGSDTPPWRGLSEKDAISAIETMKSVNPSLVSLSPHDSSDWSLRKLKEAFKEKYVALTVGKEIKL